MTNEQFDENSRQSLAVLATVTQLMKAPAAIEPIWERGQYRGYYACVADLTRQVEYKVPGPTRLDAACNLLANVRGLYPDATEATVLDREGLYGLNVYIDWTAAKALAAREQQKELTA